MEINYHYHYFGFRGILVHFLAKRLKTFRAISNHRSPGNPGITTVIIGDILFHFTIFSFIYYFSLSFSHSPVQFVPSSSVGVPCPCLTPSLYLYAPTYFSPSSLHVSECSLPVHFIILPCSNILATIGPSHVYVHTHTHTHTHTTIHIHDMHSTGVLSKLLLSCLLGPWRTTVIVVLLRPQHGFPPQQS